MSGVTPAITRSIASRTSPRRAGTAYERCHRRGGRRESRCGRCRRTRVVTETTTESKGSVSRETICCRLVITCAATATGSMVSCGFAPCPPRAEDLEREQVGCGHHRVRARPRRVPSRAPRASARPRRGRHRRARPPRRLARASRRQLLGVLEDESHLSGELVAPLDQDLRRAEQHRGVAVVAAGVHHPGARRDVREYVLLGDRQARPCRREARPPCRAARHAAGPRPTCRPGARSRARRTSAASARRRPTSRAPRTTAPDSRAGADATRSRVLRGRPRRDVSPASWWPSEGSYRERRPSRMR